MPSRNCLDLVQKEHTTKKYKILEVRRDPYNNDDTCRLRNLFYVHYLDVSVYMYLYPKEMEVLKNRCSTCFYRK